MKDLWEEHFNMSYPDYLSCSIGNEVKIIQMGELEDFIESISGKALKWREITLYSGMVNSLIRVYDWCQKKGVHEFTRSDIKNSILKNENDVARWGDWVIFGAGMVYKPEGKGSWGLNMTRVKEFLDGKKKIPLRVVKRGKEIRPIEWGTIKSVKNLMSLLDDDLKYLVTYYDNKEIPSLFD